jgi:hypothetical protein
MTMSATLLLAMQEDLFGFEMRGVGGNFRAIRKSLPSVAKMASTAARMAA